MIATEDVLFFTGGALIAWGLGRFDPNYLTWWLTGSGAFLIVLASLQVYFKTDTEAE